MKLKIKILIMGLPGSGKTTLAKILSNKLKADWFNADQIRTENNDYDFSYKGIIRQVKRMRDLANASKKKYVITDFVCPLKKQIIILKPNFIIWMDTIKKSRFSSMNKIFRPPNKFHLRITDKNLKLNLIRAVSKIQNYKWNNDRKTNIIILNSTHLKSKHKKAIENKIIKNHQVVIGFNLPKKKKNLNNNFNKTKKIILKNFSGLEDRIRFLVLSKISSIDFYQ